MSPLPDFFLVNPVDRNFRVNERFNAPRNYAFAPTKRQLHEGVDLAALDAQGSPVAVLAAQRGVVDQVGFSQNGYGNYVRIRHQWGDQQYVTWYGHLSAITVKPDQAVLAGQKIGIAGTTGFSTGIHLHLTLQHIGHGMSGYVVDDVLDPEPFFTFDDIPQFDEASWIADVTIPDETSMQPGQTFTKTWRVRNTGTRTWDAGYKLVFAGGEQMGAPGEVPLPVVPIQPAQTVNLTVHLTAPETPGRHVSRWQLRDPSGNLIPHELYTVISVHEAEKLDRAVFVADITVPDGTVLQPGESFIKRWRVRNAGATSWTTDYTLRHVSGDPMNGPDSVAVEREVKPGETVELAVRLQAPAGHGRHRSTWMLHNADGKPFDFDLYAEIQVPEQITQPSGKLSEMRWVADVTIPDESVVQPGASFVKTWRVRNSGETTWGEGYELAYFSDNQMDAPQSVPLPHAKPGDLIEVSVTLTAPESPGMHRSTWKGRDPQGTFFEFDLFALIRVPSVEQPPEDLNEMSFIADVTVPDGMAMRPGEAFVKTWRVRNTGTVAWKHGYTFAFFDDNKMDGPDAVPLPPTGPGAVAEISLMLTAPEKMGIHRSTWKGRDLQGRFFDFDMYVVIEVSDPDQTYDMLDFLRGDGRVYDLAFNWDDGGRQRVQTQVVGDHFYHVKAHEWEELWADDHFIYRGTDTSAGDGEVCTLTENGQYGSAWIPRKMTIGAPFRRTPIAVYRDKATGAEIPDKRHARPTWIVLDDVHRSFTMPGGQTVNNVAVLAAYEDDSGKPKDQPFERYYYAKRYGLVGWEGAPGRSVIVEEFAPGTVPDNQREKFTWWETMRP